MNVSHGHHGDIFGTIKFKLDDGTIDPEKRSFWVLLSSLMLFEAWIIFLTYYLSRITGSIVSFLLNRSTHFKHCNCFEAFEENCKVENDRQLDPIRTVRYLRFTKTSGHIKLTSFSISLLSGKLMFKDFLFANEDYSVRINDAWVVFSYWRFIPGRKVCFTSNVSRLHFSLNGVQIHVYNRLQRYKEIAKLFRMEKIFSDEIDVKKAMPIDSAAPSAYWDHMWSLVGVIKLDIWSGRVVIGNKLLPYMLVISMENMNSRIRLSESAADRALLSVEGQAESVRAAFLKHPDYTGKPYKDPPRTMGDGFAILQSALLHFFYRQDILGYVTLDEQSLSDQRPIWELILRFDHNTTLVPDELPKRGKRRIHLMLDVRISLLKETSIDIWFMKDDQLESVHSRCQPGSTIDLSIWWIIKEEGFSWNMHTSLLKLECTSSLPYRKLMEAETFTIKANFCYPKDLMNEFFGDSASDLVTFIPYTISIDFDIADSFEGVFLLNESNWVDPSEKDPENVEAALVGSHFNISFTLSFNDFFPEIVSSTYTIRLENALALRVRYPVGSAMAPILAALSRGAHTGTYCTPSRHGKHSKNEDEWHEIWRTESINSVIKYSYHPMVSKIASDLPPHVLQEFLPKSVDHPKDLHPDKMDVTLEIGGSEVKLTGSLIKCIIGLKDNYFGLYDSMTDVTQPEEPSTVRSVYNRVLPNAPVEAYRCMELTLDMRVSNIRAHCLTYTSFSEEQVRSDILEFCPVFYTEEIALQIKKRFKETLIQVGVTPCAAYFSRASAAQNDGYLALSGFQFRGHAMFSPVDCPWDMLVVEYCWLTEILVGEIGGCFGSPLQIITLINFLDTLLLLLIAKDEAKKVPEKFKFCQHGQKNKTCSVGSQPGRPCESEERLKYRQMRVSVDGIHLSLADECAAVTLPLPPDSSHLDTLRLKFLKKHDSETKRLKFLWNPTTVWGCACYGDTAFMTMDDSLGHFFLSHPDKKLCVLSISSCANEQPGVFQDILHPQMKLFREEFRQYYTPTRKASVQSHSTSTTSDVPSVETASFHSAMSKTTMLGKCLLSVRPLIDVYSSYLNQFYIAKSNLETPQFGSPGEIGRWVQSRVFKFFQVY
uniref:FSA_C domain-containing protein n=1 Tax=Angiostrongylus cantonensis TaxID=6313 RepID=A0A158PCJ8_ANGCA